MLRAMISAMAAWLLFGCGCSETELSGVADAMIETEPEVIPEVVVEAEPGCGNGVVEETEECDDGDDDDCNGCTAICTREMAMRVSGREPGAIILEERVPSSTASPFTIEFWFRLDEEGSSLGVLNQAHYSHVIVGIDEFEFKYYDVGEWFIGPWTDGSLEVGSWHHFAFSSWHESGTRFMALFIDGSEHSFMESEYYGYGIFPDLHMEIGNVVDGLGAGTIDDIRVSDAALYTPSDAPFTPTRRLQSTPSTIALWDFDSVTDEVVPDISGNGHDAVLLHGRFVPDECHGL